MYFPVSHLPKEIKGQKIVYFTPVNPIPNIVTHIPSPSIQTESNSNVLYVNKPYTSSTSSQDTGGIFSSNSHVSDSPVVATIPKATNQSAEYIAKEQIPDNKASLRDDLDLVRSFDVKQPNKEANKKRRHNDRQKEELGRDIRHRCHEKNRRIKEKSLYKQLNAVLGAGDCKKVSILTEATALIKQETDQEKRLLDQRRNLSVEALLKLRRFSIQLRTGEDESPCEVHQDPGLHLADILEVYLDKTASIDTAEVMRVLKGLCYKCHCVYPNENDSEMETGELQENNVEENNVGSLSEPDDDDFDSPDEFDYASSSRLYNSSTPSCSSPVSQSATMEESEMLLLTDDSDDEEQKQEKIKNMALLDEAESGLNIDDVIVALNTYHSSRSA